MNSANEPDRHRGLVTAIVLAGGQSRRMGGKDKALIPLGGKAMIAHTLERLGKQAIPMVINTNGEPDQFSEFNCPVVADVIPDHAGPLAGVLAGMRWSLKHTPKARWIVTAAADTPFLPFDLVSRLVDAAGDGPSKIALACSGSRIHPVVGLWPVALADDLETFLSREKSRKILIFVDRFPLAKVEFGSSSVDETVVDPFFNVNTPEQMAMAEEILEKKLEA